MSVHVTAMIKYADLKSLPRSSKKRSKLVSTGFAGVVCVQGKAGVEQCVEQCVETITAKMDVWAS